MNQSAKSFFKSAPIFLALTLLIASCDKDNDDEKVEYNLSATLNGGQEVPAVTTPATGSLTGTYNKTTNALTYSFSWQELSGPPVAMHFHGPAAVGEPAGVALGIDGFPSTAAGSHNGNATLTEAQEMELLDGKWYLNIHTQQNQGGEIRGQVSAQ